MAHSLFMHAVLSSTALSALLLTGCDPLCVNGLSPSEKGSAYMNDAGVCVVVGNLDDDAGTVDAGPEDAGPVEPGGLEPGWMTRVLDEGADTAERAFHFDAKGVGHFAYVKASRLYVGTTKPGDTPRHIDEALSFQAVRMVRDSLGAHHVLFTQNPVGAALHVEDGGVVRVGSPYIAYTPVDGGPDKVTRGLRYARYCP